MRCDPAAILEKKIYATFNGGKGLKGLPSICLDLLSEQRKTWSELRRGCEGLEEVRERAFSCTGLSVRLQHNPGRIKSSLAAVGEPSQPRPCFLCLDHLLQGQKGILYRGEYLILCNPMPVFFPHFTVSHLDHCDQLIEERVDSFLRLIADLGPGWAVLYNGPRCGASAPDHLHYQVVPSGRMPIEKESLDKERLARLTPVGTSLLYRLKGLGREVVVLEGTGLAGVADAFRRLLSALRRTLFIAEEPMINIAGYGIRGEKKEFRLLIFPRQKHRPSAFFRKGKGRLVISPGAIDMGGVLVAPLEKDFERLDRTRVEGIYREVSLEESLVEKAISSLLL